MAKNGHQQNAEIINRGGQKLDNPQPQKQYAFFIFWGKSINITIYIVLKNGHVGKPTKQIPEIKIPDIPANLSDFFWQILQIIYNHTRL